MLSLALAIAVIFLLLVVIALANEVQHQVNKARVIQEDRHKWMQAILNSPTEDERQQVAWNRWDAEDENKRCSPQPP